jgi:hypothetical protein
VNSAKKTRGATVIKRSTSAKQATQQYPQEDEQYWSEVYSDFKRSGEESRKAYCKTHGINYDRFGYWLSRQKKSTALIAVKVTKSLSPETRRVLASIKGTNQQELLLYDVDTVCTVMQRLS